MTSAIPETGPELRALRNAAGLTAHEVAQRLGTYEVRVARWETERDQLPEGMAARYRRAVVEMSSERTRKVMGMCRRTRKAQVAA